MLLTVRFLLQGLGGGKEKIKSSLIHLRSIKSHLQKAGVQKNPKPTSTALKNTKTKQNKKGDS